MSENLSTFTEANFQEEIQNATVPVIVDFWAEWCGPCRMLTPILEDIATERVGKVKIGKVNVDEQPELARKFNVMGIPTLVVMRDGKVVSQSSGARPKDKVLDLLR